MIFVLGISIIIVDILYLVNNKEGFKDVDLDSKDESDESDEDNKLNKQNISKIKKDKEFKSDTNDSDTESDSESISEYMQDKSIIKKLKKINPIILNEIQNMNSIEIKELNKALNEINSLKDP
jgi:hypothetical protein